MRELHRKINNKILNNFKGIEKRMKVLKTHQRIVEVIDEMNKVSGEDRKAS